jgi:hypothetical protein
MTYHIKLVDGFWCLLRNGAIIGTWRTRIEAKLGLAVERRRRGE